MKMLHALCFRPRDRDLRATSEGWPLTSSPNSDLNIIGGSRRVSNELSVLHSDDHPYRSSCLKHPNGSANQSTSIMRPVMFMATRGDD